MLISSQFVCIRPLLLGKTSGTVGIPKEAKESFFPALETMALEEEMEPSIVLPKAVAH